MSAPVVFFSMGILSAIIINKWIQSNLDAQPDTNVSDVTSVGIQTISETVTKPNVNADAVFAWFETSQPTESNMQTGLDIERTASPDHIQHLLNQIVQDDTLES